jgi:hypothetical protein
MVHVKQRLAQIRKTLQQGYSLRDTAKRFNVKRTSMIYHLQRRRELVALVMYLIDSTGATVDHKHARDMLWIELDNLETYEDQKVQREISKLERQSKKLIRDE